MTHPFHVDPRNAADMGTELAIQGRLRSRMRMLAPKVRLIAVPNGGQRTAWEAMKAKKEGMARGFPDLVALAPGSRIAFLEMKARDGSPSEAQVDMLTWLHFAGFAVGVFRHPATAMAFLHDRGFPFLCRREALAA